MQHWGSNQVAPPDEQVEEEGAEQAAHLILAEAHEFAELLLAFASHLFLHFFFSLILKSFALFAIRLPCELIIDIIDRFE